MDGLPGNRLGRRGPFAGRVLGERASEYGLPAQVSESGESGGFTRLRQQRIRATMPARRSGRVHTPDDMLRNDAQALARAGKRRPRARATLDTAMAGGDLVLERRIEVGIFLASLHASGDVVIVVEAGPVCSRP